MKLPSIGTGVQRGAGARLSGSEGMVPSVWCEQLCFLKKQDCYFYCTLIGSPSWCYSDCDAKYTQCVAMCP